MTAMEKFLNMSLTLCIFNDESPTYFKYKSDYTKILDLFICLTSLANIVSHFEVLTGNLMGSDHAPIMCVLAHNKAFKAASLTQKARFNFQKSDWINFVKVLNTLISQIDLVKDSDLLINRFQSS